jgi:hypothetical protein
MHIYAILARVCSNVTHLPGGTSYDAKGMMIRDLDKTFFVIRDARKTDRSALYGIKITQLWLVRVNLPCSNWFNIIIITLS